MKLLQEKITTILVLFVISIFFSLSGCSENQSVEKKHNATTNKPLSKVVSCPSTTSFKGKRNFKMGFSTWAFGTNENDKNELYNFIDNNADVYSEQVDGKIPWTELLANKPYPAEFLEDIKQRKDRRLKKKMLLSISILNDGRDNIAEDISGNEYDIDAALSNKKFDIAYYNYVNFLISEFNPNYVVIGMEVNDLYINKGKDTWTLYTQFMDRFRAKIKKAHPNILFSESITLHNLKTADVDNKQVYLKDVKQYAKKFDFFSVSFHPLFMGVKTKQETLSALNYLNTFTNKKIAFVETSQIAEDLFVLPLLLDVKGNACSQAEYLQALFNYSQQNNVEFLIWFTFKDFDKLWETFPFYTKDLGKIWRDTGLIDQNNVKREGYKVWSQWYKK